MIGLMGAPVGFGVGGSKKPLTISKVHNRATPSGATSFNGINFGPAEADRLIIATIDLVSSSTTPGISSCTIGGVTATLLVQGVHQPASGYTRVAAYGAIVPTGTSGSIVFSLNPGTLRSGLGVFSVLGGASLTPQDTLFSNATTPTGTLDIAAGGVALAHIGHTSGASAISWTELTEQYDGVVASPTYYSGACDAFADSETGRTIKATPNGSPYARGMVAVSLQAA